MRVGDVTQLHQLVLHGAGVTVGDEQVALLGLDGQLRAEAGGVDACGQHHGLRLAPAAVCQRHPATVDVGGFGLLEADRARRILQQPLGSVGGVDDAVARDFERPMQLVVQRWFKASQGGGVQHLAGQAVVTHAPGFFFGTGHLGVIGGEPEGAAIAVGTAGLVGRHARAPCVPQRDRCLAQRQLGRVVVQHHQVAHARCRGSAQAGIEHQHIQALARQHMGAGGTHNAGPDDDNVCVLHRPGLLKVGCPSRRDRCLR